MYFELRNLLNDTEVNALFSNEVVSQSKFPENKIAYHVLHDPWSATKNIEQRTYYTSDKLAQLNNTIVSTISKLFKINVACKYSARRLIYGPGKDMVWHYDSKNGGRVMSAILFLSERESYTGGEFKFTDSDIRGHKGDVIIYTLDEMHRVTPVTSGERQSLLFFYNEI